MSAVRLERTGLAKIRQHRPLVGALLRTTVELRDRDDRNLEFLDSNFICGRTPTLPAGVT